MPIGYYSDVVKILKKHGFELDRQSKHEVWDNPETGKKGIFVPGKIKSRHTANSILNEAGIDSKL